MKTAPKFHLYVLGDGPLRGLAATGLETEHLIDPGQIEQPALVLLAPGQKAPEQLAPIAIEVPGKASQLAEKFLRNDPPVVGRIEKNRFTLEVRTLLDADRPIVADCLRTASW